MLRRPDCVPATAPALKRSVVRTTGIAAGLFAAALATSGAAAAQANESTQTYGNDHGPTAEHPYGRQHPDAPPETDQYAFMLGVFQCELEYREFRNGEWVPNQKGRATWRASWVLDGYAILDEFTDEWGSRALNLRIFDSEAGHWKIHWAAMEVPAGDILDARRVDGRMVMEAERKTPGGYEYLQRVAFEPQGPDRYRWTSEIIYGDGNSAVMDEIECVRFE